MARSDGSSTDHLPRVPPRSALTNLDRGFIRHRVADAARRSALLRFRGGTWRWVWRYRDPRVSVSGRLADADVALAGAYGIPEFLLRHRVEQRMSESADSEPPERDNRQGHPGNRPEGTPHRTQPGRNYGALDCGATFQRYRLGHHTGSPAAWPGSPWQRVASGGTNQAMNPGEAQQRRPASVLHEPLHPW